MARKKKPSSKAKTVKSARNHERFRQFAKESEAHRKAGAQWLEMMGWEIKPLGEMTIAKTAEDWKKHSDSADLWARKAGPEFQRIEIKKLGYEFTGPDDWPHPKRTSPIADKVAIVQTKHRFDKSPPLMVIQFNVDRTWAMIIHCQGEQFREGVRQDGRFQDTVRQRYYLARMDQCKFHRVPECLWLRPPDGSSEPTTMIGNCQLSATVYPEDFECPRCRSTTYIDYPVHRRGDGVYESVRRDCAKCNRTHTFPLWYGQDTLGAKKEPAS